MLPVEPSQGTTSFKKLKHPNLLMNRKIKIQALRMLWSLVFIVTGHTALSQCTSPTSTIVNNTNCTTPNGRITFTGPTPLANYVFSIDGGNTFGTAGQTVFNGLVGGDYPTVSKLISSGCISVAINKTLTNPGNPATPTSAVLNNTSCNTPTGRITFSAPTPVANYQFSIDGGTTFGTAGQTVFNGLTGGNYPTVVRLISTTCVSAISIKAITNPAVTAPTSTPTNVTNCNTPNGRITFTAPTPVANYQFSVDNGVTYGTAGQTVFNNLTAGTYLTRAKLVSSGCVSAAVSKAIANPTVTAPTSAVTNVTNCNTPNGKITFSAPAPVANYQFSIDNGVTYGTAGQVAFTGLSAGTYLTRAKLVSTGCISAAVSKSIANPVVTAPTSAFVSPTNCNTPNGTITFSAPTPVASYQFSVNNGVSFGTTGQVSFTGLAAGTYATRAKLVSSGCISAPVNKVLVNPTVTAPTSTIGTSSCLTSTGSLTFTAPTPVASYQFSTDNGVSFGTTGQTSFTGLAPGAYLTRAKLVSSGCISAAVSKTITTTAVTAPTSTVVNLTNCNTPNGSITFTAPTPLANYQFSTDGGTTFGAAGVAAFPGLEDGTYATVAKLVSTGCVSAVVNKTVTKPAVTAPTSTVAHVTNCTTPNGSITFTAPTPLANYQFSINGGTTFGAAGATVFSGLDKGVYPTVSKLVSSGCVSAVVNKTVNPPVIAGANKSICLNQPVTMTANTVAGASWVADPANPAVTTITTPTSGTTTVTDFTATGTYIFYWQTASCKDTVSVDVSDCLSPLDCANFGYLFQSISGSGTDFITVNLQTGVYTTLYTDITTSPNAINAIGYNVTDGHIWGSSIGSPANSIARVGANGVPVYYTIPGLPAGSYNVGTVDDNGILYLYTSNATDIYRVDVNPNSPTYLTLLSPVLTTTAMSIADWAYNPVDDRIYGVNTNAAAPIHQLLRVNPHTGGVTVVGTVTSSHAAFNSGSFGAAYLDANGNLYVSDNIAGGIYKLPVVQNIFSNTTAALFSQGAISNGNDGTLCHYACVKPNAGRDTVICSTGVAIMSATGTSGQQWIEMDGNPGTSNITDASDANTIISGFSSAGVYNYVWNNGGLCNDTASITVYTCVLDTISAEPSCDTLTICGTPGSIAPSGSTVYSTCGLDPNEQAQGDLVLDENGCAVWNPNGSTQVDPITSCVVTCNGTICDTSYFIITPNCGVLPITLSEFKGSVRNCDVTLAWSTSSEENSAWFDVEQKTTAGWIAVKRIAAAGSSTGEIKYSATVPMEPGVVNYFRLRLVDKDARVKHSNTLAYRCNGKSLVQVWPNPVSNELFVDGLNGRNEIRLIDAVGGLISRISTNAVKERINVSALPAGIYFIQVINEQGIAIAREKIIKK